MKYSIHNTKIPPDKRSSINEKIIYVVETEDNQGITKEDIFNAYTGDGGLHGLNFNNFDNFHAFTQAKKEIEQGQFFTPHDICKFIVDCIKPHQHDLIADLTCGMGNFFNYLPSEHNIYGNELDIKAFKVAQYLYPSANMKCEDIRYYDPKVKFDLILGNPPFNLRWDIGKDEYLSQLYYCLKSFDLLKPGGILAIIVPHSFMNDDFMDGNIIKRMNEKYNFICQFDLPSNAFLGVGVSHFETKVMFFQKRSEHLEFIPYSLEKIQNVRVDDSVADIIYRQHIQPAIDKKEKVKSKLFFENLHSQKDDDTDFQYQVKKWLFIISRHPKLQKSYAACLEYVNKYYKHAA